MSQNRPLHPSSKPREVKGRVPAANRKVNAESSTGGQIGSGTRRDRAAAWNVGLSGSGGKKSRFSIQQLVEFCRVGFCESVSAHGVAMGRGFHNLGNSRFGCDIFAGVVWMLGTGY